MTIPADTPTASNPYLDRVAAILEAEPSLSANGLEPPRREPGFEKRRERLCEQQFLDAVEWLERRCEKSKVRRYNSYWLKHQIQREGGPYITNGAMILAALCCEYTYARREWNPIFNIKLKLRAATRPIDTFMNALHSGEDRHKQRA